MQSGNSGSPQQGQGDNQANIERLLRELNDKMGLMVDVIEKRPRSDSPSSLYFSRRKHDIEIPGMEEVGDTRQFDELSGREKKQKVRQYSAKFAEENATMKQGLDNLNRLAFYTAGLDDIQKQHYKDEYERLKADYNRKLKLYAEEQTNIDAQIEAEKEAANAERAIAAGYRNLKEYTDKIAENDAYNERTESRREASTLVARSGLGNTSVGRTVQNAINRQQNMDSLRNFGSNLATPGTGMSKSIAESLLGTGKAAKGAASMLSFFGKGLGGVAKILGGPFLTILSFAIDALKAVGKVANEYQKQTAMFIRYQTEIERISYEQSKQHATLETQIDVEAVKYIGDMALKQMEIQGANMLETLDILNSQFVKSMEIGTGSLMKGINQTAYDAATASIEAGASIQKLAVHQGQREMQTELYAAQRGFEMEKNVAGAQADIYVADAAAAVERLSKANELEQNQLDMAANATNSLISGDFGGAIANGIGFFRNAENNTTTGEYASGNTSAMNASQVKIDTYKAFGVDKIPGWDSSLVGPNAVGAATMGLINGGDRSGYREKETAIVENAAQQITQDADAVKTKTELHYTKASAELDNRIKLAEKETEIVTQAAEKTIDAATNVEKNWLALTQHVEGFIEKFDKRFNDLGLNMGMLNSANLFDYKQSQFAVIANAARSFGKTEEEVAKYQSDYVGDTGRSKLFSVSDTRQLAALGTYLGDDGLATRFASEMEIFNNGAADSVDLLNETLQSVNRIGLNGRKYTKELVNNLKMAQKYNFKGGTKEVMEMAKWAQKTRFNLQSLGGIVDKIQEGGIEGVLQQSAQFQVLGGHAAMNSDPLGMLYDAWGDNASLAKRFQDMTKGFGTLNKKTGETTFDNITENMQIAAIAKAQGRSVEELRGEIMERNKRDTVKAQLSPNQRKNFNQDQLDYLGSVAQYNKEKQQFEVKVWDEAKQAYESKAVSDVEQADLARLMPEEHEERMETWMEKLVSIVSKMSGETVAENAEVAASTFKQTLDSFNNRLQQMHQSYLDNYEEFTKHIGEEQTRIETSVKGYLQSFADNMQNDTLGINAEVDKIKAAGNDIAAALGGVAEILNTSKERIGEAAGMDISKMSGARDTGSIKADAQYRVDEPKEKQAKSRPPDSNDYQDYLWNETVGRFLSNYNENTGTFNGTPYAPVYATNTAKSRAPLLPGIGQPGVSNDGVMSGNGESMTVSASNVTPINDGSVTLTKTHPNDVGLFAKVGGPFDTLFNGVFGTVQRIAAAFDETKYSDRSMPYQNVLNNIAENVGKISEDRKQAQDVNVNINGRLTLDCGNKSLDLVTIMRQDPMIVRRITEQVADQIYKNQNGGKTEGPGAGVRYSSMA